MKHRIRVVIAKLGLDAHDRGVRFIAKSLQEAGMEVIYLGLFQTPENVVRVAVQESADVIAISSLSGEHRVYLPALMKALTAAAAEDIHVIVGGLVLGDDAAQLRDLGVGVYGPGTSMNLVVQDIEAMVSREAGVSWTSA